MKLLDNATPPPHHLLQFPPKLVLLPLKALMFKVILEEGISPLEKASSVAVAVLTGRWGSLIKVIL
jgi:hypothetical protein